MKTGEQMIGAIKIKDGLFIGDELAALDLEFIQTNKVKFVINCASKELKNRFSYLGVEYLDLDWEETDQQVLFDEKEKTLQRIIEIVDRSMDNQESCLVHSKRGQNRSCCVLAAYFMSKFKWSLYKTLEYLNSRRPDLEIKASFFHQLNRLEQKVMRQNQMVISNGWENQVATIDELVLRNTFVNGRNQQIDQMYLNKQHNQEVLKKQVKQKLKWSQSLVQYIEQTVKKAYKKRIPKNGIIKNLKVNRLLKKKNKRSDSSIYLQNSDKENIDNQNLKQQARNIDDLKQAFFNFKEKKQQIEKKEEQFLKQNNYLSDVRKVDSSFMNSKSDSSFGNKTTNASFNQLSLGYGQKHCSSKNVGSITNTTVMNSKNTIMNMNNVQNNILKINMNANNTNTNTNINTNSNNNVNSRINKDIQKKTNMRCNSSSQLENEFNHYQQNRQYNLFTNKYLKYNPNTNKKVDTNSNQLQYSNGLKEISQKRLSLQEKDQKKMPLEENKRNSYISNQQNSYISNQQNSCISNQQNSYMSNQQYMKENQMNYYRSNWNKHKKSIDRKEQSDNRVVEQSIKNNSRLRKDSPMYKQGLNNKKGQEQWYQKNIQKRLRILQDQENKQYHMNNVYRQNKDQKVKGIESTKNINSLISQVMSRQSCHQNTVKHNGSQYDCSMNSCKQQPVKARYQQNVEQKGKNQCKVGPYRLDNSRYSLLEQDNR